MTGVLSVVTAVHPAGAGHLGATYASLAGQPMPEGWTWEWLLQEDGPVGISSDPSFSDARIRAGNGRAGGPGVARTLALGRATGDLVRVLDADDLLPPGALARDIAALCTHPSAGYATSAALDLLPDGSLVPGPAVPEGRVVRGALLGHWRDHSYRLPVHPATLCIRRDLLLALGGWMALPASEDTGLLLAANAVADGYHLAEPGLHYRKWTGQATAQPAHTDPEELQARVRLIEARARALESWIVAT